MGVTVLGIQHHFYPRSPCGERLLVILYLILRMLFLSTLSLRRATVDTVEFAGSMLFLSTLSLRRATAFVIIANELVLHFYPRSPCGERPDEIAARLCDY